MIEQEVQGLQADPRSIRPGSHLPLASTNGSKTALAPDMKIWHLFRAGIRAGDGVTWPGSSKQAKSDL